MRWPRDRPHRHGRGRAPGPRAPAEADHRRLVGLPAAARLRAFRAIADEVGANLLVDMAHFAGLVAAGLHPSPLPHAHIVTTTTHKTLGGPRGGIILTNDEELAKKISSAVFPGQQGGPLEHVIAAKAVAFKMAAEPRLQGAPAAHARGRQDPRRAAHGPDVPPRHQRAHGRHRRAPRAGRPARLRARRSAGRGSAPRVGITVNRNAVPSTRGRRWSPRACASAPRPWPPVASAPTFTEVADIIAAALRRRLRRRRRRRPAGSRRPP